MNALDTNILVRFMVRDEPAQARVAKSLIRSAVAREEALFISLPVLCEFVWVLRISYKQRRAAIADAIQAVLESAAFEVERQDCVIASLQLFREGRAGFADYLIGTLAQHRGCEHTYTFDRKLRGADGFKVV